MSFPDIRFCPGTLSEGHATYSPTCLKRMFGGKLVSHILPFDLKTPDEKTQELLLENRKQMSISGYQEKLSLVLEKNKLRLTAHGEQGEYILKPPPRDLKRVGDFPANEHLTMQIARQVYGIDTAENSLIFSADGTPCYITKRFDVRQGGGKWAVEDFASLAGRTQENAGDNYKYDFSYEEMAGLIQQYLPAWRVEVERFFRLVVFNYLFSNGDAHLKNFSVIETRDGDFVLSPAYDLVDSRLHLTDSDFALSKGLFADTVLVKYSTPPDPATGKDFREFGKRIGVMATRLDKLLQPFIDPQPKVVDMVGRSFLSDSSRSSYLKHYRTRRNNLER
ncbi:MAG: HipA domain-containing protein [Bacteroidetes bacterium]|nr:HipA domain-containing protein [Bacteroidota bacterium]